MKTPFVLFTLNEANFWDKKLRTDSWFENLKIFVSKNFKKEGKKNKQEWCLSNQVTLQESDEGKAMKWVGKDSKEVCWVAWVRLIWFPLM